MYLGWSLWNQQFEFTIATSSSGPGEVASVGLVKLNHPARATKLSEQPA